METKFVIDQGTLKQKMSTPASCKIACNKDSRSQLADFFKSRFYALSCRDALVTPYDTRRRVGIPFYL